MKTYQKTLVVVEEDLDQLQHVNNVRYVQWVQDLAEAHWKQNAKITIRANYFWVLLSHHIEYKSEAVLGDTLKLTTYVSESKGVTSIRQVRIENETTKRVVVLSETKWCFMSVTTKRPTRITDEVIGLFQ